MVAILIGVITHDPTRTVTVYVAAPLVHERLDVGGTFTASALRGISFKLWETRFRVVPDHRQALFCDEINKLLVVTGFVGSDGIETHQLVEIAERDHPVPVPEGSTRFGKLLYGHSYPVRGGIEG